MNSASNQNVAVDPDFPAPQGALPVWSKVFTRPTEQTFIEITGHPDAKAKSAYIWMFIAGTISGLIGSLLNFVVGYAAFQQAVTSELGQELPLNPAAVGIGGLLAAICYAPLTGVFSVLGFAISTGIVHATARFFGGEGSFDKLAYVIGAILAPVTLISAFMIPLNAIPLALFCAVPVLLGVSIYAAYLQVTAIKAVHHFGWGEAAAAFFLPTILLLLLCGVVFLGLMRVAGPTINEILEQYRQFQP